ncbi:unnamed protein product [Urochloa humidicola]
MSYMRGDRLTMMRKLVKGLAKPAPTWLKVMENSHNESLLQQTLAASHHVLLKEAKKASASTINYKDEYSDPSASSSSVISTGKLGVLNAP